MVAFRDAATHRGEVEVGISRPWECRIWRRRQGYYPWLGREQEDHVRERVELAHLLLHLRQHHTVDSIVGNVRLCAVDAV